MKQSLKRILLKIYPIAPLRIKLAIIALLYSNGPQELEFRGDL